MMEEMAEHGAGGAAGEFSREAQAKLNTRLFAEIHAGMDELRSRFYALELERDRLADEARELFRCRQLLAEAEEQNAQMRDERAQLLAEIAGRDRKLARVAAGALVDTRG